MKKRKKLLERADFPSLFFYSRKLGIVSHVTEMKLGKCNFGRFFARKWGETHKKRVAFCDIFLRGERILPCFDMKTCKNGPSQL